MLKYVIPACEGCEYCVLREGLPNECTHPYVCPKLYAAVKAMKS